jgi:hypothetical protein
MPHAFVPAFLHAAQAAWLFKSSHCRQIPGSLLILASVSAPIRRATVPVVGPAPAPVITKNLPFFFSLTAKDYPNCSDGMLSRLMSP